MLLLRNLHIRHRYKTLPTVNQGYVGVKLSPAWVTLGWGHLIFYLIFYAKHPAIDQARWPCLPRAYFISQPIFLDGSEIKSGTRLKKLGRKHIQPCVSFVLAAICWRLREADTRDQNHSLQISVFVRVVYSWAQNWWKTFWCPVAHMQRNDSNRSM